MRDVPRVGVPCIVNWFGTPLLKRKLMLESLAAAVLVVVAQLSVNPNLSAGAPGTGDNATDDIQMFCAFLPNTAFAPPSPPFPRYQMPADCSLTGINARHSEPSAGSRLPKPSPRLAKRASINSVLVSGDVHPIC